MTPAQTRAVDEHLGAPGLWYEDRGHVYRLLGNERTDIYLTTGGNLRLGNRTLIRPDGTRSPIR